MNPLAGTCDMKAQTNALHLIALLAHHNYMEIGLGRCSEFASGHGTAHGGQEWPQALSQTVAAARRSLKGRNKPQDAGGV